MNFSSFRQNCLLFNKFLQSLLFHSLTFDKIPYRYHPAVSPIFVKEPTKLETETLRTRLEYTHTEQVSHNWNTIDNLRLNCTVKQSLKVRLVVETTYVFTVGKMHDLPAIKTSEKDMQKRFDKFAKDLTMRGKKHSNEMLDRWTKCFS